MPIDPTIRGGRSSGRSNRIDPTRVRPRDGYSERDEIVMVQMRLEGQTLREIAEAFSIRSADLRRVLSAKGVK